MCVRGLQGVARGLIALVLWGLMALPAQAEVLLGIDVLQRNGFAHLRDGQRVGLLSNPAGVNHQGTPTWQVLFEADAVNLVALFGPEHGFDGMAKATGYVEHATHAPTGLPVYSLYGPTRSPTPEMLAQVDVMLVDLQDIGVRSYTFAAAMKLVMEACFRKGIAVMVLDRPNPLGGLKVDGPPLDPSLISYVGPFPTPYVHGLTMAELARMALQEPGWLDLTEQQRRQARLIVVPMQGWQRGMLWPRTGLEWVPPSPVIPDFPAALGYAMTGLGCQIGGFGHGYGTPYPFRLLSHRSLSPAELARRLNALQLPGLRFREFSRVVDGRTVRGAYVEVTSYALLRPTELSLYLMQLACEIHAPGNPFLQASTAQERSYQIHVGTEQLWRALCEHGAAFNLRAFLEAWRVSANDFQQRSRQYWLY